jgi:hypothetical protein
MRSLEPLNLAVVWVPANPGVLAAILGASVSQSYGESEVLPKLQKVRRRQKLHASEQPDLDNSRRNAVYHIYSLALDFRGKGDLSLGDSEATSQCFSREPDEAWECLCLTTRLWVGKLTVCFASHDMFASYDVQCLVEG